MSKNNLSGRLALLQTLSFVMTKMLKLSTDLVVGRFMLKISKPSINIEWRKVCLFLQWQHFSSVFKIIYSTISAYGKHNLHKPTYPDPFSLSLSLWPVHQQRRRETVGRHQPNYFSSTSQIFLSDSSFFWTVAVEPRQQNANAMMTFPKPKPWPQGAQA